MDSRHPGQSHTPVIGRRCRGDHVHQATSQQSRCSRGRSMLGLTPWEPKDRGPRDCSRKASLEPKRGSTSRGKGIPGRGNSQCQGLEARKRSRGESWSREPCGKQVCCGGRGGGDTGEPGAASFQELGGRGPNFHWGRSCPPRWEQITEPWAEKQAAWGGGQVGLADA